MSLLPSRLPHGGEVPDSRVVIGEAAGPLDDKAAVTAEDEPSAPAGSQFVSPPTGISWLRFADHQTLS